MSVNSPQKQKLQLTGLNLFSISLFVLLFGALYLAYTLAFPFMHSIIMGIVFAMLCAPLKSKISKFFKLTNNITLTILTLLVVVVCILLPLIFLLATLIPQLIIVTAKLTEWLSTQDTNEVIESGPIADLLNWAENNFSFIDFDQLNIRGMLVTFISRLSQTLLSFVGSFLRNALSFGIDFSIFFLVLFFLLLDGSKFLQRTVYLFPLRQEQTEAIIASFRKVTRAVLVGGVLVAILQGVVGGIGLFIVGLPALVGGSLMATTSFVPIFGTALVWVPLVVWLYFQGMTWQCVFLLLWCGILVTGIDNFVRPVFMRNSAGLSIFFLFMSILGGITVYGGLGVFYGPLILGFAVVMLDIYAEEYRCMLQRHWDPVISNAAGKPKMSSTSENSNNSTGNSGNNINNPCNNKDLSVQNKKK